MPIFVMQCENCENPHSKPAGFHALPRPCTSNDPEMLSLSSSAVFRTYSFLKKTPHLTAWKTVNIRRLSADSGCAMVKSRYLYTCVFNPTLDAKWREACESDDNTVKHPRHWWRLWSTNAQDTNWDCKETNYSNRLATLDHGTHDADY